MARGKGLPSWFSWTMFAFVDEALSKGYAAYARVVAQLPWLFIIIPLVITVVLVPGLFFINHATDVPFLYTPRNARYYYERAVIEEHWPYLDGNYAPNRAVTYRRQCQIVVTTKNETGNILDPENRQMTNNINNWVMQNIYIFDKGRKYGYQDLCYRMYTGECWDNRILIMANERYQESPDDFEFPAFPVGTTKVYTASSIGGVLLRAYGPNQENLTDLVHSARGWWLIFPLKYDEKRDHLSGKWEVEFEKAMKSINHTVLNINYFHSQTLYDELTRNGQIAISKVWFSFVLLLVFATACLVVWVHPSSKGYLLVDWARSKSTLAALACLTGGMGICWAVGLLAYVGYTYSAIVTTMPFLVLAICVDNMFLLMAAWRRTNAEDTVKDRMSETLRQAAVSITITALTDGLSFGIAATTKIPAVEQFCIHTAVAILFTFIIQMTFFLGWMVITGRIEYAGRHHLLVCKVVPLQEIGHSTLTQKLWQMGTVPQHCKHASDEALVKVPVKSKKFFRDWYGSVLMHPAVKVIVLLWYLLYLGISGYGCTFVQEGLKPLHLLPEDSYAKNYYYSLEEFFYPYGQEVQIVISNPPDMSDPAGVDEAYDIINNFTNTKYTQGMEGVSIFLDDYLIYLQTSNLQLEVKQHPDRFAEILRYTFFQLHPYSRWKADVRFGDPARGIPESKISAFRFLIGTRHFKYQHDQMRASQLLRDIGDSMPQYNISTMYGFWGFMDQYRLVIPGTMQSVFVALICMITICIFLVPHILCAVCVAISILSIAFGVIGSVSMWGCDFDVLMMICITMSVGFSVDFAAHISHAYVSSKLRDPNDRAREALGNLGWPIVEGAASTVVCVAVLGTINAYMLQLFFKCVFMVMVHGTLHSLVFLPVLLSVVVRGENICCDSCYKSNKKL